MQPTPQLILKRYWGYDRFRPPQGEIIQSILERKDVIALLPTGGGKSLCYQLPSLMLPGKTIVISPLISLMQDQVKELQQRNIRAKAIHSGLSATAIEAILDDFSYGPLKLLYVSPERISTEVFQTRFYMANVSLIAIDEAHCISQWGHDFRPDYLNINMLREIKPDVPMVALTATATQAIVEDIAEQLAIKDPKIYRNSFARDNISFTTIRAEDKNREFLNLIAKMKGTGIVYMRSRVNCVKIAKFLNKKGVKSSYYHAGMTNEERDKAQQDWMSNKVRIIVATNAFGMGINKPDVRFVIHLDLPSSIEEYYQEAGRAGRDGKLSFAVTIVRNSDLVSVLKNFATYHPSLEEIKTIYIALCKYLRVGYDEGIANEYFIDLIKFSKSININVTKILNCLKILQKQGWLELSEGITTPSRVQVICNPREVNDIYPQLDPRYKVLSQLLRSYEGIFVDPVNVSESKLSMVLNMSIEKIKLYLKVLQNESMIYYTPYSSDPKLVMLKARPRDESFRIDEKAYNTHKESNWNKLNSMIKLHSADVCRQRLILEYFDEDDAFDCGKCDVCLGSADEDYDNNIRLEVTRMITNARNGVNAKDIILSFGYNKRKKVYKCLEDLENEQLIRVDINGNLRNSGL